MPSGTRLGFPAWWACITPLFSLIRSWNPPAVAPVQSTGFELRRMYKWKNYNPSFLTPGPLVFLLCTWQLTPVSACLAANLLLIIASGSPLVDYPAPTSIHMVHGEPTPLQPLGCSQYKAGQLISSQWPLWLALGHFQGRVYPEAAEAMLSGPSLARAPSKLEWVPAMWSHDCLFCWHFQD